MERYLGAVLVIGVAANELFHAIFDGLEFSSNVEIVSQVIAMKLTWDPDSWRSINSPIIATIGYSLIWLAHAASGGIGLAGAYSLLKSNGELNKQRERAFRLAILGVGIGAVLYLVGFVTVASGWFLLYSAPTPPNFTAAAESLFLCYMAVIVYLILIRR